MTRPVDEHIVTDMSVSKRNKETTEAALIEAAVEMFRREGYTKTRVSDIVGRCGLSQGTFYLYFKSKEDVLRRIMMDFMEEMNRAISGVTTVFSGDSGDDVLRNLTKFLKKVLLVHRQHLGTAEIIWREGSGHGGVFAELFDDIYARFLETIRSCLIEDRAHGRIRPEHTDEAAVFLVSMFERSSFYFMIVQGDTDIDKLASGMAKLILYGLLPDSKRPHPASCVE